MIKDMTFKNRNYLVEVDPVNVTNPEAPYMKVSLLSPEGKKLLLLEKLGLPGETEDDLLQEGRTIAEHHANNVADRGTPSKRSSTKEWCDNEKE